MCCVVSNDEHDNMARMMNKFSFTFSSSLTDAKLLWTRLGGRECVPVVIAAERGAHFYELLHHIMMENDMTHTKEEKACGRMMMVK